jgi:hypothetical protein
MGGPVPTPSPPTIAAMASLADESRPARGDTADTPPVGDAAVPGDRIHDAPKPDTRARAVSAARPRLDAAAHVLRQWAAPVAVFFVIRAIGVLVLADMAYANGKSLGDRLAAWDGEWMLAIAEHGYGGVPPGLTDARGVHTADTAYAFFPGYPYLVSLVARLPLVTTYGAAITVNVVLCVFAAAGVARLGALCAERMSAAPPWSGDRVRRVLPRSLTLLVPAAPDGRRTTTRGSDNPASDIPGSPNPRTVGLIAVALFAATPMSIVLNMAYTEALFCALAVWALIGVLEGRWLLAGVCALFAGATRPTGIVVIGVVVLAGLSALRRRPGRRPADARTRIRAAIALSSIGYFGYLCAVWAHTGNPLGWFTIQTEGWDTRFDFGVAAVRFVNDTLAHSGEVAPVATAWIMLSTPLLITVAVWARLPWPVLLYAALVVVSIVASSGLMMSRARLLLPAFVLLIPFAVIMARWRPAAIAATLVPIVAASSWFGAHMLTVYPHAM